MSQPMWWLVFAIYVVAVWAVIYVLGGVFEGSSWVLGLVLALAGIVGGAYIQRLRVKDLMRRDEDASS